MNNLKIFLSYDRRTQWIYLEAFIMLGWARLMKSRPFAKIAPSLGTQMIETSYTSIETDQTVLRLISQAIDRMSKHTFWESMCLVKAMAAMKMLERRRIESTMYLGTAKDESGKLIAHAWLRSGPYYITGHEVMNRFTVVSKFAKQLNSNKGGQSL
ncbi:lasso peptide biosynthesis B2 protein [Paenibacillus sp. LjRoot153]|uniref:lasso peptide biosynthesis B2 protein n=1 Tax=Paenibacillus sp. LjRoot153 TaxID=3342270 RepID=UPI003F4FC417